MPFGKNKKMALGAILMTAILLTGCGCTQQAAVPPDTTQPTETQPEQPQIKQYAVRFVIGEQVVSMQMVQEGQSPNVPVVSRQGFLFDHWENENGETVDAENLKVSGDVVLSAVLYPYLTAHAPYLFADENGDIRPTEAMTGAELTQAMNALVTDPEVITRLTLPGEEEIVTGSMLMRILEKCYSQKELQNISLEADAPVTRGAFAVALNGLLGRTGNVVLAEGQTLPMDNPIHTQEGIAVLEATLEHTHEDAGLPIEQAVLQMSWQPGFTNVAGWLYYADEDGNVQTESTLGTLTFGADGRYTCGNEELDAIAAELVFSFIRENPAADREELLMKAFEYSRDKFTYVNRGLLEHGQTGWEVEKALQMFEKGSGNCYNFAASFWILARFLGYDATCYSGKCLSNEGPHGWVDIVMDGKTYIFDPQLAWREATGGRENWGEDMFKVPEYLWHQWRYIYP